ncbi:MAG: SUMF1/EgtB/PvdO family nonheme iron enzyme [Spirochaetota bacterium]
MRAPMKGLAVLVFSVFILGTAWGQGIPLKLTADRNGVAVYINDLLAGYANPSFSITLFPGEYEVSAAAQGFPLYKIGIRLHASPVDLHVDFDQLKTLSNLVFLGQTPTAPPTPAAPPSGLPLAPPPPMPPAPPAPAKPSLPFPEMVLVPAGATSPQNGGLRLPYPIEVSKYEVTNQEFAAFLNDAKIPPGATLPNNLPLYGIGDPAAQIGHDGSKFFVKPWKDPSGKSIDVSDYPVNLVSWHGATAYCNWLSAKQGLSPAYENSGWWRLDLGGRERQGLVALEKIEGFRLPYQGWAVIGAQTVPETLVKEWEYVFRGGPSGMATMYAGSGNPAETGWFSTTVRGVPGNTNLYNETGTMKVGLKRPNELGLYDLSGNVAEWGHEASLQGGSFEASPGPLSSLSFSSALEGKGRAFGFRVFRTALTPPPSSTPGGLPSGGLPPAAEKDKYSFVPIRGISSLRAIARGPDRYVIGGNGAVPAVSLDGGRSWIVGRKAPLINITGLAYGNGIYVATGDSGGVATSPDGLNWTAERSVIANHLNGVVWNGAQFVASGHYGTILVSRDGKTWTQIPTGMVSHLMTPAYGRGRTVIVGIDGTVFHTSDGMNWQRTSLGVPSQAFYGIAFGERGFVAAGSGSGSSILLSLDGRQWSQVYRDAANLNLASVHWDGDVYVVAGQGFILQSRDGTIWEKLDIAPGKQFNRMGSGEDGSLVILQYDGTGVHVRNR